MSVKRNGFYRFSKWLPETILGDDDAREVIDDDLEHWQQHFAAMSIKTEVRQRKKGVMTQVALFREGKNPWLA
jgi:hypothetical protein